MKDLKLFGISDSINSNTLCTPWSIIHFLFGTVFGIICIEIFGYSYSMSFFLLLLFHTLYEFNDIRIYFEKKNLNNWNDNSYINSITDTIFTILGFLFIFCINIKNIINLLILLILLISIIIYFKMNKIEMFNI